MKLLFITSLSLFVGAVTSTNCFPTGFKVLKTLNSNEEFKGQSINNDNGASMYVEPDGKLVAKYEAGNVNPVYANTCHCATCENYEFKVQGNDGHLLVIPPNGFNADFLYKTNQHNNNNNQVTLGVGPVSAQIYKGCNLLWDSAQDAGECNSPDVGTDPGTGDNNCLDGIKVITTSYATDGQSSYSGNGASLLLHNNGNFKCKNGNDIVYESRCACQNNRFLRELTECPAYGIKFQNDGQLSVRAVPVDSGNELWKTNKRSDDQGEYAIVINGNDGNKCQIWKLNDSSCPSSLLWDSGNSADTNNVQCYGHAI